MPSVSVASPPAAVVSMVRDSAELGGRDRFACSLPIWTLLLQLAESFGWKPSGTTYSSARPLLVESAVRHNYQPGDAQDQKRVAAEDALAWAMALNEARHSPHLLGMLESTAAATAAAAGAADAPFTVVLDEFIAYAFGGAFYFAREAEIPPEPL